MSKSVKRFRKYNEDYEEYNDDYDHREHLKEKRMRSALRAKDKSSLLYLMDDEEDY